MEQKIILEQFKEWLRKNKLNSFLEKYIETSLKYLYSNYYEFVLDNNPYDYSGEIHQTSDKNIDKIQTLKELVDCYTGDRQATYTSHYGWHFVQVRDVIQEEVDELYYKYMGEFISKNPSLFDVTQEELDDDKISDLIELNDFMWEYNVDILSYLESFFDTAENLDFDLSLLKEN